MTSPTPFTFATTQALADLGSAASRFNWNVRALTVLKTITAEGRSPTADEALVLAHYSAFGESALIQKAVQIVQGRYQPTDDLADLLTADEAGAIARAALTAFYTPLWLADAIWQIVAPALAAIDHPQILEPATGTGAFIATMPTALRQRSAIMGVELDQASSRIFQALHPDVRHFGAQGFEATHLPENTFDLTISNVPFASVKVTDPLFPRAEQELCATLHDFFIAKMLKLTRPGGLVVALTSYGTLDKKRSAVRRWLAQHGRLISALRLPNGLFMEGAGSASGCDLLIIQKYAEGEQPDAAPTWIDSQRYALTVGTPTTSAVTSQKMDYGAETMLSPLFAPASDRLIGDYVVVRSARYGEGNFYVVNPPTGTPVEVAVAARLNNDAIPVVAPRPATASVATPSQPSRTRITDAVLFAEQVLTTKHQQRLDAARLVFTTAKALFAAEVQTTEAIDVEALRAQLNAAYDAFVAAYGCFHSKDNQKLLGGVILEYPVLLALEVAPCFVSGTTTAEKAPIFAQRVSLPSRHPDAGSCTLEEALTWSLADRARVDLPFIAALAGVTPDEAAHGLAGRIYADLDTTHARWVLADELLSGNVRAKLDQARRLATLHPAFAAHIPALEAVQPASLTRVQIRVNLGATWLPTDLIADFIATLVPEFRVCNGTVAFHAQINAWKITAPRQARQSDNAYARWATPYRNFFDIFDAVIHQRELVVMDEDEDGKRTLNQPATLEANAVAERIKEAFQNWLWADETRAQAMEQRYNELFNTHVVRRRYDGSHLAIAGLNTSGLRTGDADPHQKDAIWRILSQQATYIAHPVGSGKTLMMLGGISEALRRGMARKVLVCVPNSIVQQWAADVLRFFPGLRVLAMTTKDMEKSRRPQFLAHIATGQWDIVVVGVTTFTRLPLPLAIRKAFYAEEITSLRSYLHDLYNQDTRDDKAKKRDKALKRIEGRVMQLEAKLASLDATIVRENERVLNLVELGFDMLVVDEFHMYKNLAFSTIKTRVAGLPGGGSERAFDMWQKIRFFMQQGHKVVAASATPIANTLCEAYVNMKFLQWDLMQELGIAHFDAWAAQFAEPSLSFELRPDANGFRTVMRMSRFINLPELHQLTRQVMDVKLEEELNLPRPAIITGKPVPVVMPASPQLREYLAELGQRADAIKTGQVSPEIDNMLCITSDGRLAALDMRLVGGTRDAGNKIDRLVENVLARYHESTPWSGAQIVFCDLATPKGHA